MVTTPQEISLEDVRKGSEMFKKVNVPILGIVENMSWFTCTECDTKHHMFGSGGGERVAAELGLPFLGGVPFGKNVCEGGDNGKPVMIGNPELGETHFCASFASTLDIRDRLSLRGAAESAVDGLADTTSTLPRFHQPTSHI